MRVCLTAVRSVSSPFSRHRLEVLIFICICKVELQRDRFDIPEILMVGISDVSARAEVMHDWHNNAA
eukprot:COSAG01_NODE_9349_length_2473_cov_2.327717_3_plen_67_part_00